MREIVLNGVHYQYVGEIRPRQIQPWKPALRGTGGLQYSDFSQASMEEYHDFRNGIGLQSDIEGQTARHWWGEGVDVSTARSAVLNPLVTTAGSFGVAPVKIIDFQNGTYSIIILSSTSLSIDLKYKLQKRKNYIRIILND